MRWKIGVLLGISNRSIVGQSMGLVLG